MWVSHILLIAKPLGGWVLFFVGFDIKRHHRDESDPQVIWAPTSRIDFEVWEWNKIIIGQGN